MVPEAENSIPTLLQARSTFFVVVCRSQMLTTIDFNNQLGLGAQKIGNEAGNGNLPAEAESLQLSAAQYLP